MQYGELLTGVAWLGYAGVIGVMLNSVSYGFARDNLCAGSMNPAQLRESMREFASEHPVGRCFFNPGARAALRTYERSAHVNR